MSEDESQKQQASSLIAEIQNLLTQAQQVSSDLSTRHQSVSSQITELENQRSTLQQVLTSIETIRSEAEGKKNSVDSDIQIISSKRNEFEELKNQAQTARDDLVQKQGAAAAKISEIESAYERITQQLKVLFDDSADQSGNTIRAVVGQIHDSNTNIKTLLSEIKRESDTTSAEIKQALEDSEEKITLMQNTTEEKLKALVDNYTTGFGDLKQSLEKEIRSLLPEAGAAGLASTFFQAKSKYAITATEPKSKNLAIRLLLQFSHFIVSALTPVFFYALFILPLAGIFYIFYDLLHFIESQQPSDIHIDPSILIYRVLLSLPLAWVSFFGWSSIRLHRRLYEEYNYKQRVMQLYHSFKEEIGSDDDDNHKALMGIMLAAVADKPSLAMNQYDSSGKGLLSEIGIGDFIKRNLRRGSVSQKTEDVI